MVTSELASCRRASVDRSATTARAGPATTLAKMLVSRKPTMASGRPQATLSPNAVPNCTEKATSSMPSAQNTEPMAMKGRRLPQRER